MKIVVTGGSGPLGAEVVRRLQGRGATVTSASRRTGVDLATGAGLEAALDGVDCVVHSATHRLRPRRVDLDGTRRMIKILAGRSAPPHVVYISIVGCDRVPQHYYRAKYACELVLQRSRLPVTVVRATQFHTLVEAIARTATVGPVALVARGMSFQPCDHHWVAAELADAALDPAPSGYQRAADLAGPEQVSLAEAVTLMRAKSGKVAPRLITIPAIGATLRGYEAGANLPDPGAKIGGASFREFLQR
ncbi:MAG TPA: NAD(P)H-binding protein [Propionibacteriaceae bacterium]|nr:NAD(P)H-binding protein [Propionibacteriaceae bacterium]